LVPLTALLLIAALAGPSAASLLCDWTCGDSHAQTAAAGSCHEGSAASTPTLAAGHSCHELAPATPSIAGKTPSVDLRVVATLSVAAVDPVPPLRLIDGTVSADAAIHAPPPLYTPLRI
jgi:hypothetical protein